MDYSIEIENTLKELFFEKWMDEDDWKLFLKEIELKTGVTIYSLSKDIEKGVENGHPLEVQLSLIKQLFKTV